MIHYKKNEIDPWIISDFKTVLTFSLWCICGQTILFLRYINLYHVSFYYLLQASINMEYHHLNWILLREAFKKTHNKTYWKFHMLEGEGQWGSFFICYHERFEMQKKPFWAFLDTFIFSPYDTPPPAILWAKSWKFSKYFWSFKGKKWKSLRMIQKWFLDNKKSPKNFPYVGGQPTYGKFHMFRRFFFWKLP